MSKEVILPYDYESHTKTMVRFTETISTRRWPAKFYMSIAVFEELEQPEHIDVVLRRREVQEEE